MVVQAHPEIRQYKVMGFGSRRLSLRNRRFLRKYQPVHVSHNTPLGLPKRLGTASLLPVSPSVVEERGHLRKTNGGFPSSLHSITGIRDQFGEMIGLAGCLTSPSSSCSSLSPTAWNLLPRSWKKSLHLSSDPVRSSESL